jgi:hypothetical protein
MEASIACVAPSFAIVRLRDCLRCDSRHCLCGPSSGDGVRSDSFFARSPWNGRAGCAENPSDGLPFNEAQLLQVFTGARAVMAAKNFATDEELEAVIR